MPLIQRPAYGWQDALAEAAPHSASGNLTRGWPSELPDPQTTPAVQAASLPRLSAQPGTSPVRGRPKPEQLGLEEPGVAPTGEPSMGASRSSIFMQSAY
ncbi:hypothetical protein ACIGXM_14465 [Kitasatospora sp. NPDC052896]|uniref:hypothetical protein n=1 Tax=Kitasatospora sp. NPDC052896 TaxID=3364061 RepID=UPI0037C6D64D